MATTGSDPVTCTPLLSLLCTARAGRTQADGPKTFTRAQPLRPRRSVTPSLFTVTFAAVGAETPRRPRNAVPLCAPRPTTACSFHPTIACVRACVSVHVISPRQSSRYFCRARLSIAQNTIKQLKLITIAAPAAIRNRFVYAAHRHRQRVRHCPN